MKLKVYLVKSKQKENSFFEYKGLQRKFFDKGSNPVGFFIECVDKL